MDRYDISVIGAGVSGTLFAYHLLDLSRDKNVHVHLIEKNDQAGRGLAYDTSHDIHLLNVPVAKMGAFPAAINDFYNWLLSAGKSYGPGDFVPRSVFGDYIQSRWSALISDPSIQEKLHHHQTEAIDIIVEGNSPKYKVQLRDGLRINADRIMLSLGNFSPGPPRNASDSLINSDQYHADPWKEGLTESISQYEDVLIIGSGLTMVDVVCMLHRKGHKGKMISVSTHGFFPQVHKQVSAYPDFYEELKNYDTVVETYSVFKHHLRKAKAQGIDWRAVVDAIRPHNQTIWKNWNTIQKRIFIEHLRHIWGVARHRMPEANATILNEVLQSGQLQIHAGRIQKADLRDKKVFVRFFERGNKTLSEQVADRAINCTGPQSNLQKVGSTLLNNLYAKGLICNDELGMGLLANEHGALFSSSGEASESLFTMGPPMKGILWEITAVPEIRQQAYDLAGKWLKDIL